VCSKEGEQIFTNWIKTLLIETQINQNENDEDDEENPDPTKYIDRSTLNLLYEVLNVKLTHGINFQSFFDLMQLASEQMGLMQNDYESMEDFLHIEVLNIFCKNFIRGFSKLIIDLGFDDMLIDEIEI
jgi:hypothetical protein